MNNIKSYYRNLKFKKGGNLNGGCGGPGEPDCPPVTVDSKDDPRYKAYKDSLNLYEFNQLQRKLEPKRGQKKILGLFDSIDIEVLPDDVKNQKILENKAAEIIKESDNIKYSTYKHAKKYPEKTYTSTNRHGDPKKVLSAYDSYKAVEVPSWDIHSPNIKPEGMWKGAAWNEDYSNVKPQQEVIVNPEQSAQAPSQSPLQPQPRAKVAPLADLTGSGIETNLDISGDKFNPVKKAPEVNKWDLTEHTKNAYGDYNTTTKTTNTDEAHRRLLKFEGDKNSISRGKHNKIDIAPSQSFQKGGKLDTRSYYKQLRSKQQR